MRLRFQRLLWVFQTQSAQHSRQQITTVVIGKRVDTAQWSSFQLLIRYFSVADCIRLNIF